MPAVSLMLAMTPHMSQLAQAVEDHIVQDEQSASPHSAAANSQERSPSRVTFSVERRPQGFAAARHTSCTITAEVVVRGELPDEDNTPFEQLIWSKRFKVGKASREGETILEHRTITVPVPEEVFRYAERSIALEEEEHEMSGAEVPVREKRRIERERRAQEKRAYRVAPVPDPPAEDDDDEVDEYGRRIGGGGGKRSRTTTSSIHPTKSDLYAQEELAAQFAVVDELPDGCTFHLMCTLEIVKDTQRAGDEPYLLRRGNYETPIDAKAMLAADSSLLPVEMFAPFVEVTASSVDIVAFASVFAVVGDQLAAATHGDESNPSLLSSFVTLAMAAQYEHLVFNVFRPELGLYRQGLQMALNRRAGSGSASPPSSMRQQQQQAMMQHQARGGGGQQHSPAPARPALGHNAVAPTMMPQPQQVQQQQQPQQEQSSGHPQVPHFPPNKLQQQHQRQQEQQRYQRQQQAPQQQQQQQQSRPPPPARAAHHHHDVVSDSDEDDEHLNNTQPRQHEQQQQQQQRQQQQARALAPPARSSQQQQRPSAVAEGQEQYRRQPSEESQHRSPSTRGAALRQLEEQQQQQRQRRANPQQQEEEPVTSSRRAPKPASKQAVLSTILHRASSNGKW